jgi:hypothetical protein
MSIERTPGTRPQDRSPEPPPRAAGLPAGLPATAILDLQRTAGNRAVGALIAKTGGPGAATQGVAPPKRGSLLEAIGGSKGTLSELLALVKPYELWKLMDDLQTTDGAAILTLLEAIGGSPIWLTRLARPILARGGDLGIVGRLLHEDDDINVLLDLVAAATTLPQLPRLMRIAESPPLVLRMLRQEPDPAALVPICNDLSGSLDLLPYLLEAAGTPLVAQLAAHESRLSTLVALVVAATDVTRLPGLLATVHDRDLLLRLVKLEPSSPLLLPLCTAVADVTSLPALLPLVADRTLLRTLLAKERDATVLAGLVQAIDDVPELPNLLDLIPARPLLAECLALERSGARLVPLCRAIPDHTGLPKLLEAVPDRALLAKIVAQEQNGAVALPLVAACSPPSVLPRLLELCPERPILAETLKDARGDGAGLLPVFEAFTERSALAGLLRSFAKDRGTLVKLAGHESSSLELAKLVKSVGATKAGGLLALLSAVSDRMLVAQLASLAKQYELAELAELVGRVTAPERLPQLIRARKWKHSDLLELVHLEPSCEVLLEVAGVASTPAAMKEVLELDGDRSRLLANLAREPNRTTLRDLYRALRGAPELAGPLLDACPDRKGLETMLSRVADPAALLRLLAGTKTAAKALVPLLELDADADRVLACLRLLPADRLLMLLKRVSRADDLPALIAKVDHLELWELLGFEGDTVALSRLIARGGMAPKQLGKLIKAVPDRDQLDRALKAGYTGDLVQLATSSLKGTSKIGELLELGIEAGPLIDLAGVEGDSARLVELLGLLPKPAELISLLRMINGPSILLLNCARLTTDVPTLRTAFGLEDVYDAEPLLTAISDRALFRRLAGAERRKGVLRKLLAHVPDPAAVERFLALLDAGMRPRIDEFATAVPDPAVLEAVLSLYGGAMDRERLLRILAALGHDGVGGTDILTTLTSMAGAMAEDALEASIVRMRGNLKTTTAGASATPLTAAGGKKALLGSEIVEHVRHTGAMGRGLAGVEGRYPTGQDPTQLTDVNLWRDCRIGGITYPDVNQPAHRETAAQKLIRQKMALRTLMEKYPDRAEIVQRIFAHDEGRTPRAFVSVANEDTYAAKAHTVDRHVLNGTGKIGNTTDLARRACLKKPKCNETASAFHSLGDADTAIAGAITATIAANWAHYRDLIVRVGVIPVIRRACAANLGICLTKRDNPQDVAYSAAVMSGGRPLLDDGSGTSLTYEDPVQRVEVSVVVSSAAAAHGWSVFTSFPLT